VWVAVCDRAWLRACLQALEEAQRPANRIIPEFAPDMAPAAWVIGESADPQWVVTGDGVAVLPFTAAALAVGRMPSVDEASTEDNALPVFAEPGVAAMAEQLLQRKVQLQQKPQRWLNAAQGGWDLAQFDLASSGRARAFKQIGARWEDFAHAPQWRAARWGAGALLVANLAGLNAWALHESSVLDAKRSGLGAVLTSTFPNVKVVYDAPLQMEREVAALRQASGGASGRDLETMLSALSIAVPPGKAAAGIDYANGEVRVKGLGLGSEETANLAARMRSMGYAARLEGDTLLVTQAAPREAAR
jgi:general secretion pathway protein L